VPVRPLSRGAKELDAMGLVADAAVSTSNWQRSPMASTRARGPGLFFTEHPVLFAMSVGGACTASACSFSLASKATGRRRIGLAVLGLLTAVEGAGIVRARNRARS
jgi:hypothetical protein